MSDPFNNSTYYLYRLIKYVFHHSGKNWQQQQPRHWSRWRHEELHLLGEAPKLEAGAAHRVLHLRAEHGRSKLRSSLYLHSILKIS